LVQSYPAGLRNVDGDPDDVLIRAHQILVNVVLASILDQGQVLQDLANPAWIVTKALTKRNIAFHALAVDRLVKESDLVLDAGQRPVVTSKICGHRIRRKLRQGLGVSDVELHGVSPLPIRSMSAPRPATLKTCARGR